MANTELHRPDTVLEDRVRSVLRDAVNTVMKRKGWRQIDVCKLFNVPSSTISDIARGARPNRYGIAFLVNLLNKMGQTVDISVAPAKNGETGATVVRFDDTEVIIPA